MGFAYSYYFFPDKHPIDCPIKAKTSKNCPTCGFSRSFAYYTHFNFAQGKHENPLSFKVFIFFVLQFILRLGILIYYFTTRNNFSQQTIIIDSIISISLFLLAFLPILLNF